MNDIMMTLAGNVCDEPVLATGRFTAHTYEVNEQLRYAFRLEAASIGHDLSRGTAEFRKATRGLAPGHLPADENGAPVDEGDQWPDFADAEQPAPAPAASGLGSGDSGGADTVLAGAG
jgi:single-strand DNA-binding protein